MSPADYAGLHSRYAQILETQSEAELVDLSDFGPTIELAWQKAMRVIHNAGYSATGLNPELLTAKDVRQLIETHKTVLDSAIAKAPLSDVMRTALERSNFIFSGMKVFHELNEAFPSLINTSGELKSFADFLNDVRSIHTTYNVNYLRAEYNFAVSSAEAAAQWEQIVDDSDRYDLQYRTVADSRVRPAHAALNGVTLPPDDPFWREFYPPNGWNCRCRVIQVRRGKYPSTDSSEAWRLGEEATANDTRRMFRFNPGNDRKTFPDYNPYTISRCRDCDISGNKLARSFIDENHLCQACRFIREMKVDESTRRLNKRERLDIAAAANTWANKHLPKITLPDGTPAFRLIVNLENGDELIIGKKLFTETFAKCKNSRRLAETMDMATKINEWISSARYVRTEAGIHHDCDFRVYEVETDSGIIELKAKVTEGFIAYVMKLV